MIWARRPFRSVQLRARREAAAAAREELARIAEVYSGAPNAGMPTLCGIHEQPTETAFHRDWRRAAGSTSPAAAADAPRITPLDRRS